MTFVATADGNDMIVAILWVGAYPRALPDSSLDL